MQQHFEVIAIGSDELEISDMLTTIIEDGFYEDEVLDKARFCIDHEEFWFDIDKLSEYEFLQKLGPANHPQVFLSLDLISDITFDQANEIVKVFKRLDDRVMFSGFLDMVEEFVTLEMVDKLLELWPIDVGEILNELDQLDFELNQ